MSKTKWILLAVLAVVLAGGVTDWMMMQPKAPKPENTGNPAVDAVAKLPDWWTGAWEANAQPSVVETDAVVPLTPEYAAKLEAIRASIKVGGPKPGNPRCRPEGMPLFMEKVGPLFDINFMTDRVVFNSAAMETRVIYTDGRKLPDEVPLDFFDGTAIGHWDGDTLNTEVIGIHPDVEMIPGIENGGGLKVQEKIRLIGPDKLEDQITLTSEKAFTQPYTYTRTFTRHRDWEVSDYVCINSSQGEGQLAGQRSEAEMKASTWALPPTRRIGHPAANADTLPGGSWESIAKLPDWSRKDGLWDYDNVGNENQYDTPIGMTPPFAARLAMLRETSKKGGDIPTNNYHCWPRGAVQGMKAAQTSFFVVFVPGRVTLIPFDAVARRFYTDGRPHPDNMELSFNGHSVGHWENNDTLVVDTVGLRPDVQMWNGMDSGGQLHITDRWHLNEKGKIQIDTVLETPVSLTEPYKYSRTYTFQRNMVTMEDYCAQNNRDVDPKTGLQTFDLTPPPE